MLYEMAQVVLKIKRVVGLNPYCNGICSMSWTKFTVKSDGLGVLILIVMEYAL